MNEKTLKFTARLLIAIGLVLLCIPALADLDISAYKWFIPCGFLISAIGTLLPPWVSSKIFPR